MDCEATGVDWSRYLVWQDCRPSTELSTTERRIARFAGCQSDLAESNIKQRGSLNCSNTRRLTPQDLSSLSIWRIVSRRDGLPSSATSIGGTITTASPTD